MQCPGPHQCQYPLFLSSLCVSPSPQYCWTLYHRSSSSSPSSLSSLSRCPHIRNLNSVPCPARRRTRSLQSLGAEVSSQKIPMANSSISQSTLRWRIRSSVRTLWAIHSCNASVFLLTFCSYGPFVVGSHVRSSSICSRLLSCVFSRMQFFEYTHACPWVCRAGRWASDRRCVSREP